MQKSESIKNLMTALGGFQADVSSIKKDSKNPFFKSKYASLSSILDVIQPSLTKCKLTFTQTPDEDTHLETFLCHSESGEFISARYKLNCVPSIPKELGTPIVTPQALGSAITYARRYSLTAILGLNIDDDDDGNAASGNPPQQQAPHAQLVQRAQRPQQAPAQPNQPQTTFNKTYADANAVLAVLPTCSTEKELTDLYYANRPFVDGNSDMSKRFVEKKQTINNGGKLIPTDNQITQVCNRILKGNAKAYHDAVNAFILNQNQLAALQQAAANASQLEEALKIKYSKPEDIANVISHCETLEQITRLHSNNALIIDRDGQLLTIMNSRKNVLKAA